MNPVTVFLTLVAVLLLAVCLGFRVTGSLKRKAAREKDEADAWRLSPSGPNAAVHHEPSRYAPDPESKP